MSDNKPARLPEGDVTALSDYFDDDGSRQSLAYSGDQVRALLAAERERWAAPLHVAVCQAVALLNMAPEMARCVEGRQARDILRQALADYADAYMNEPAPERERALVAAKHTTAPPGEQR